MSNNQPSAIGALSFRLRRRGPDMLMIDLHLTHLPPSRPLSAISQVRVRMPVTPSGSPLYSRLEVSAKNLYHRRLVAESGAKACWICYKPSATVLITPDQDDWFHICAGHLTDRKFAIAKDAEDLAEKKRKEELDKEIELVKKEYDEKLKAKLAKRKDKKGDKSEKKDEKKDETQDEKDEKEKEDKLKELEGKKEPPKTTVEGPRIFELQKNFFQMRMQKKRDAETAKKSRERMKAVGAFPSAPTGGL